MSPSEGCAGLEVAGRRRRRNRLTQSRSGCVRPRTGLTVLAGEKPATKITMTIKLSISSIIQRSWKVVL